MLLLPPVAHSTNTHVVDLCRPLTSDLFDIFNVFPPPATIEIEIFNVSCNFVFGVQGSITDNYNASDDAALLLLLHWVTERASVPQRVTTVPKCRMTRQLQTYHTYVTFPLLSRSHAKRLRATTN